MAKLIDQAIGSVVKLNVSGVATDFIVVHQGLPGTMYDSSCDGVWLLMKDIYTKSMWKAMVGNTHSNDNYGTSDIHDYLNGTLYPAFDPDIRAVMQEVKIPYTKGSGTSGSVQTGSNGLSTNVFLLSVTEVGFSNTEAKTEGATLAYFKGATKDNWTAYYAGTKTSWWMRSPRTNNGQVWVAGAESGSGMSYAYAGNTSGVRPAVIMSKDCGVNSSGFVLPSSGINGAANIGGTWKELSASHVNIGGVWKDVSEGYENIGGVWKPLS